MNWFPWDVRRWLPIGQFLTLFCLFLFLVVSCVGQNSSNSPPPSSSAGDRITIGTTLKPRTMDPADNYELAGEYLHYNLGETLYRYAPGTSQLKPQLATALPKVSQDGLTYIIPVRPNVLFHDGTPFDAEAMAFSLRRFIENKGKPSFLLSDIVNSVKATGKYELTIMLKKPFAAFPSLLAFPGTCAVSPKAYEIGAGKFKPNEFVGTGPYKLVKFSSESQQLDVFDKYWGEKPANQGVNVQVLTSSSNLFNTFRTRGVDIAYLTLEPEQIKRLKDGASTGKWQAIESQGSSTTYMIFNLKSKPFDNPSVRVAVAYMINRSLLNERALAGQGVPLYSMLPTTFDVYKPVFKEQYGDGDTAKAKQLLQQAGYSPTNPLYVQVWYPTSSAPRQLAATVLKAFAEQQLGGTLQFEVNNVDAATFFKNIPQGIYPTTLGNWYPDFLDPDNYVQPFLECTKGSPNSGCDDGASKTQGSFYYSSRVNQLIAQERKELNPQARKAIFAEIQDLVAKDVPYIPLWQDKEFAFSQKGVTGLTINPTQDFAFWTIKK